MKGYRTYQIVGVLVILFAISVIAKVDVGEINEKLEGFMELAQTGLIFYGAILAAMKIKSPSPMRHEKNV